MTVMAPVENEGIEWHRKVWEEAMVEEWGTQDFEQRDEEILLKWALIWVNLEVEEFEETHDWRTFSSESSIWNQMV